MSHSTLAGKRVLITGAASGIGFATARAFGSFGASVAVNHLPDDPRGASAVEELSRIGNPVYSAPGDVARRESAEGMVSEAAAALGGLDVLVNPRNSGPTSCRQIFSGPSGARELPPITCGQAGARWSTRRRLRP
jgi:3-oxoacyl-[acyl-carrier protein] reductase